MFDFTKPCNMECFKEITNDINELVDMQSSVAKQVGILFDHEEYHRGVRIAHTNLIKVMTHANNIDAKMVNVIKRKLGDLYYSTIITSSETPKDHVLYRNFCIDFRDMLLVHDKFIDGESIFSPEQLDGLNAMIGEPTVVLVDLQALDSKLDILKKSFNCTKSRSRENRFKENHRKTLEFYLSKIVKKEVIVEADYVNLRRATIGVFTDECGDFETLKTHVKIENIDCVIGDKSIFDEDMRIDGTIGKKDKVVSCPMVNNLRKELALKSISNTNDMDFYRRKIVELQLEFDTIKNKERKLNSIVTELTNV